MNASEVVLRKKRRIYSFDPDPDVKDMLEKARRAGLVMGEVLNEAMRSCGKTVITNLAGKRADTLRSLSFSQPELQLAGYSN